MIRHLGGLSQQYLHIQRGLPKERKRHSEDKKDVHMHFEKTQYILGVLESPLCL